MEEIDKILHEFAGNVSNIKGQFLAPMFTLRCHSAFRAASSLALAGHVAETFVIIRSILEYAGYGLLISQDATLETLWASRHQDSDAPKKIAKSFNPTAIRAVLEQIDAHESQRFDLFYQRSIDFGARPNSHALNSGMQVEEGEKETIFTILYLHAGDNPQRHALKSLAQAGLCALNVFVRAFPDRAKEWKIAEKVDAVVRNFPL